MARLGQFRRDTLANWQTQNPVLADGEFALVALDSNNPKKYNAWVCGDGTSQFTSLFQYSLWDSLPIVQELSFGNTTQVPSVNAVANHIFPKLTYLMGCGIYLTYQGDNIINCVCTANSQAFLYSEYKYISISSKNENVTTLDRTLNILFYNGNTGHFEITGDINKININCVILEIFYVYISSPTYINYTTPIVAKNWNTDNVLSYQQTKPIWQYIKRATRVYAGAINIYKTGMELSVTVNQNTYLWCETGYCGPLPASSSILSLRNSMPNLIYYSLSEGKVKIAYDSYNGGLSKFSDIQEKDILLEAYFFYNDTLVGTFWTSPFVGKNYSVIDSIYPSYSSYSSRSEIDEINKTNDLINIPFSIKILRKVGCIGDSYTKGYIIPSGGSVVENENYAWPHYLEGITNNKYLNWGVSGSTAKGWMNGAAKLSQVQAQGNKCQAYIVGLMINDRSNSSWNQYYTPVGVITDIGTNNDTYYAWYYKLIQAIITVNPDAPIFCNTCPRYSKSDTYNQAVRDIVSYCHNNNQKVYLVDLASDIYLTNLFFGNNIFNQDQVNGHYTSIGYEFMAECLKYAISDTINNNISEFQTIHLVPFDE